MPVKDVKLKRKPEDRPYKMTISRLTVDKLGVKLYDRVSAVIAEVVANSYDADATRVEIKAPMDTLLAIKKKGVIKEQGFTIEVADDGIGMTPGEVQDFYLIVGNERRLDPRRGNVSKKYKRKVMGRKGVGKLAPFGICQRIELISRGGKRVAGLDENGKTAKGYKTAHLILDRTKILSDTDEPYYPDPGPLDGTVHREHGTLLRLTVFDHRRVPKLNDFERQLAQRFGLSSPKWKITLIDTTKPEGATSRSRAVGTFSVVTLKDTRINFNSKEPRVSDSKGKPVSNLTAGFTLDGRFYPVTGWVAYSEKPYKDDLMAGVRIYCRGKIAAQTHLFNLKAGFTGEYDVRSYLVGELHADWLDEEEDLIRTDRQDILWSHDLGHTLEEWGQGVVKFIGQITREPSRKRAWDLFAEVTDIEKVVEKAFPHQDQKDLRDNTLDIAQAIVRTAREDEITDPDQAGMLLQLSLLLGPHITLDRKLREAAADKGSPLAVVTGILKTARIAELASFGRIAEDRVKVIERVEKLKDASGTLESAFQELITQAPWLVDSQWAPITSNQTFSTLKSEFQKYYKEETGSDLNLDDFSDPNKRVDFVLSNQDGALELVEIKRPRHGLADTEADRIVNYIVVMEKFLKAPGNAEFLKKFPSLHVTLVCDKLSLSDVRRAALDKYENNGQLTHINWKTFLLRARRAHQDFLTQADRLRKVAAKRG